MALLSGSTQLMAQCGMMPVLQDYNTGYTNHDPLYVGYGVDGSLYITNGTYYADSSASVGNEVTCDSLDYVGTGLVVVDDAIWDQEVGTQSGGIIVGNTGAGEVVITNDATVISYASGAVGIDIGANAYGSVLVDGSVLEDTGGGLAVGNNLVSASSGQGILVVQNGGTVSDYSGQIGGNTTGSSVSLTGAGSLWTNSAGLVVGSFWTPAVNTLSIASGAAVYSHNADLENGQVLINGAGSVWTNQAGLTFDISGSTANANSLVIQNGGRMGCGSSVYVDSGTATVSNLNSAWIIGNGLTLEGSLTNLCSLSVDAGALVSVNGDISVGDGGNSSVNLNGASSVLTNNGTLYIAIAFTETSSGVGNVTVSNGAALYSSSGLLGTGGTIDVDGASSWSCPGGINNWGTIDLSNDGTLKAGSLSVNNGGLLTGVGSVAGNVTVAGGGTISSGPGGALTFSNNLTLNPSATVHFSIGATSMPILVNGNLNLSGALSLSAASGFGAGTNTLFTCLGSLNPGTTVFTNMPSGYNYALDENTPGLVKLIVTRGHPVLGNVQLTGTGINLSASGGIALQTCYVLTSTNLSLPENQWSVLLTNQFNAAGALNFSNALVPGILQQFYLLKEP